MDTTESVGQGVTEVRAFGHISVRHSLSPTALFTVIVGLSDRTVHVQEGLPFAVEPRRTSNGDVHILLQSPYSLATSHYSFKVGDRVYNKLPFKKRSQTHHKYEIKLPNELNPIHSVVGPSSSTNLLLLYWLPL